MKVTGKTARTLCVQTGKSHGNLTLDAARSIFVCGQHTYDFLAPFAFHIHLLVTL